MADLDPQVQIRLIDLAWAIVKETSPLPTQQRDTQVKERAERFDQAYKIVVKTIKEA